MDGIVTELKNYLAMMQADFPIILSAGLSIISAFIILGLGWAAAKIFRRIVRNSTLGSRHVDATLRPVLASALFYVIIATTIYAFLTKLGVPSTSLIAVFGAAGLAIGLALKDTLSNIAAGVMMLTLRPLEVGDYVDTPNASGTVMEIGLFATHLKNSEGIYIYIPNRSVWNTRIQNFARHTERKFTADIGVSYDADLKQVQDILLGVMRGNPLVLQTPALPECHVMNFAQGAIQVSARCWMPATNWLKNTSDMRIAMKQALDQAGVEIPYPQRVETSKPGI